MYLKNIGFEQLLDLVKQLPDEKLNALKATLKAQDKPVRKQKKNKDLALLLLNGPVMSSKQFESFSLNREKWKTWR